MDRRNFLVGTAVVGTALACGMQKLSAIEMAENAKEELRKEAGRTVNRIADYFGENAFTMFNCSSVFTKDQKCLTFKVFVGDTCKSLSIESNYPTQFFRYMGFRVGRDTFEKELVKQIRLKCPNMMTLVNTWAKPPIEKNRIFYATQKVEITEPWDGKTKYSIGSSGKWISSLQ